MKCHLVWQWSVFCLLTHLAGATLLPWGRFLVNFGASRTIIRPEPFCGIPMGYVKEKLVEEIRIIYWENSLGQRQAKGRGDSCPSGGVTWGPRCLTCLDTTITGTTCGSFGHGWVCFANWELRHVLCECLRLCEKRARFHGDRFVLPSDIMKGLPKRIKKKLVAVHSDI